MEHCLVFHPMLLLLLYLKCTNPTKSKTDISLSDVKTRPFRGKNLRQADSETNKIFVIDGKAAKGELLSL